MINWIETEKTFGFTSPNDFGTTKRPKVICECDDCHKKRAITIRVKSQVINGQIPWTCPSCVNLRPEINSRLSRNTKRQWNKAEYRKERSQSSTTLWQNDEYRRNHSAKVKAALADPSVRTKISKTTRARFADPAVREAQRLASEQLWQDHDFKARHQEIMSSIVTRDKISTALRLKWADPVYRNRALKALAEIVKNTDVLAKLATATKANWTNEAYRERILSALNAPATLAKMSDSAKQHWADPEYRLKVIDATRAALRTPTVIAKLSAASKAKWQDSDYRIKLTKAIAAQLGKPSKIQEMLYQILDDLGVKYEREGEATAIGYYVFDCLIPKQGSLQQHLLIECQGDYWHTLPDATRRDKAKFTYINEYFKTHKVMYFWEREFYQRDRVRNRLLSLLGITGASTDFSFSNVTVKRLSSSKHFLDLYHYLGPGRGGKRTYGAFIGDALVAVALFSSPLRQNTAGQFGKQSHQILECSRFCIHPNYQKKNFASWFLTRCTRDFQGILLYSYADATAGHDGTIYKAAGWLLHHDVKPDYWYMDADGYIMHKRTLYSRACRMSMKEAEFAKKFGYRKVFGGPKKCFIKQT